jgi:hypothetical protein
MTEVRLVVELRPVPESSNRALKALIDTLTHKALREVARRGGAVLEPTKVERTKVV